MDAEPRLCLKESGQLLGLSRVPNQPSTGGDMERDFCLAQWQSKWYTVPQNAHPKQQLLHFPLSAHGYHKPGGEREKNCLDAAEIDVLQHG